MRRQDWCTSGVTGRAQSNSVSLRVQVVLTDCEDAVLLNLRECAAANAEPRQAPGQSAQAAAFPSQVCPLKAMPCLANSLIVCR